MLMFASFLYPSCRRFEESHAAQIMNVFPEAYTFRQEKNVPTFSSSVKKGGYQLTVEPIVVSGQNIPLLFEDPVSSKNVICWLIYSLD